MDMSEIDTSKIVLVVVVIIVIWLIYSWCTSRRNKTNYVIQQPNYPVPVQQQQQQSSYDIPIANNVDLARYAGKWYEIARTPVGYEEGCTSTTAHYTLNRNGSLSIHKLCVINGQEDQATGIAIPENGMLIPGTTVLKYGVMRASFHGKNFDDFIIMVLDPNYQYSMVGSRDKKNLWIWSRTPQLDPKVLQSLVNYAAQYGFPVNTLISGQ